MVGLQFQYMSIRLIRKKQMVNLINEQQERAKQKLFEISYFDDQRHFHESRTLLPQTWWHRQPPSEPKQLKIKTTKEVQKKKSQSLGQRIDDTSSIQNLSARKVNKTLQLDLLAESSLIFNTLESNRVFVGNKNTPVKSARSHFPERIPQHRNKRRIETMPAIKQRSHLKLPKEDFFSAKKFQTLLETSKIYGGQKLNLSSFLTEKNASYVKVKYKIKRDVFNSLEERMVNTRQPLF